MIKKGYYFCVCLIIVLIVAVVVPTVLVPSLKKDELTSAEGEVGEEQEDLFDAENEDILLGGEPEQEEDDLSGGNVQDVEEAKLNFKNAWAAFNYAMAKSKELKSYVSINQTANATTKILGVGVNVKANVNRKVYNNIDDVYVLTDTKTSFDVGNLGIDMSMYEGYNACTLFEVAENHVQDADGWAMTYDEYVEQNGITLYQIPYVINRDTAEILGGLVKKDSCYEITMRLKSKKAWEGYLKALCNIIQIDEEPTIQEVILKIKIDKKYGIFQSIEADETFTFNYPYSGRKYKLTANGKIVMKFNYFTDISNTIKELRKRVYP